MLSRALLRQCCVFLGNATDLQGGETIRKEPAPAPHPAIAGG